MTDTNQRAIENAITWLTAHLHEFADHDAWPQFADEIRDARSQLENVLSAGTRPVVGVRCLDLDCNALLRQVYDDPKPCEHDTDAKRHVRNLVRENATRRPEGRPLIPLGQIRLAIRAGRRPCERCDQGGRRDTWKCPACKRTYDDETYRRAVAQDHAEANPLRTGPEIARTLGVKPTRIRQWVARGKLKPRAKTPRGRPKYDIREARRLAMRGEVA